MTMVININDSLLFSLLLFGLIFYWFLHYIIYTILHVIKYSFTKLIR